jgi:ACS family hexuronate transporter-like MFS transporter
MSEESTAPGPIPAAGTPAKVRIGNYRWLICAMLFFATTINYMDRQVIGILAPTLGKEIGWNEAQYANIVLCFQLAYAIGMLLAGGIIDRIGTRLGYSIALTVWSFAAMAHGLARSATGFAVARFSLGLGESGNFPAAIKTVAEWFPRRERALATGIFNAGANVGAIVAPLAVPWLTLTWGWQTAFYATGAVGMIWLLFWHRIYHRPHEHPRLSKPELDYIMQDAAEPSTKIPWLPLLGYRQTWAFIVGKFLPDAVWWFYLYWTAKFLDKNFGISLSKVSLPLVTIYLMADVGSIAGGWLSSSLLKRGWSVNAARKTAMLVCASLIVPVTFAGMTHDLWTAVLLIAVAASAHQGWSANIFTLVSDTFPRRAVASVVGIGGMAGAVGGMVLSATIGVILQRVGSYMPIFCIAGSAYLLALLVIHILVPQMEPVRIDLPAPEEESKTHEDQP